MSVHTVPEGGGRNTHEALLNMEIYNNCVITHDSYITQME